MTEDDRLIDMVRSAYEPPAVPREEMWARIEAARAAGRSGATTTAPGVEPAADVIVLRPRRRVWAQWGAALAAMLVLGIGIGRVSLQWATQVEPAATPATAQAEPSGDLTAYRVAATRHLQKTEVLLASLSVDARVQGTGEVSTWASDLLTDTRLLLASPAADDPATRRLLEDLELVLAQVAAIPASRAEEEVQLIQEGLNQSDVLLRLRAATAGPALVGT